MEPKSPSKLKLSVSGLTQYKRVWRILGFALLIVLLVTGTSFAYYSWEAKNALKSLYYTIVVDCGSTGTRVNVYEWNRRSTGSQQAPILTKSYPKNSAKSQHREKLCRYHCMQTEPGLDKYVGNSSGIQASLEPLIRLAEKWVPFERHSDTPVFVLATAGLRMLAAEDAKWVLDKVEEILREHTFRYSRNWIRVLSGKEEAYYGWLALNFKMRRFVNFSSLPTLGLLDLGGSSLQAVVEVDEVKDNRHFIRSSIGLIEHKLLAYSLPEFGLNEAFDRTVAMLSQMQKFNQSSDDRIQVRHPCLSYDFTQNYTCYHCVKPSESDPQDFSSQIQKTEFSYTYLVGDPNWEQCKALAKAVAMNISTLDWLQATGGPNRTESLFFFSGSHILNLTAISHSKERFHALSAFFAVSDALNLSSRANMTEIWEKGRDICLKSWDSNISRNQNYAAQYCFRVPYIASLIKDTLFLGDREILFGPGDVSWTLGAALVEGQYLWQSDPEAGTSSSTFTNMRIISSPIFVFVLLLCLLFIVYCCQIKLPMPAKKVPAVGTALQMYVHAKRRPS